MYDVLLPFAYAVCTSPGRIWNGACRIALLVFERLLPGQKGQPQQGVVGGVQQQEWQFGLHLGGESQHLIQSSI